MYKEFEKAIYNAVLDEQKIIIQKVAKKIVNYNINKPDALENLKKEINHLIKIDIDFLQK